jgi:hypothetical protein
MTTRRVRLFVWRNVKALADWQDGLCVAAARSKEEAIDAIMRWDPEDGEPTIASRLRDELEATEPQEYDAPHGLHVWGSS